MGMYDTNIVQISLGEVFASKEYTITRAEGMGIGEIQKELVIKAITAACNDKIREAADKLLIDGRKQGLTQIDGRKQGENLAFVSMAEENMPLSILIAVVIMFLFCLCIIAFCVIRQQHKFKQLEQRKRVQRENLFHDKNKAMHRPHHVISCCSPHTSTSFHPRLVINDNVMTPKRMLYSPQSQQSNIVTTPITPSLQQYDQQIVPSSNGRKYKEGIDSMGDITNVIKEMVDEDVNNESDECKAHVLDRKETDIGYDELMKEDGSSDDTQFSHLRDDEFVIVGDDEDKEAEEMTMTMTTTRMNVNEVSVVIDDDMISLMSIGSLSERHREGKYIKTKTKSNVFEVIKEDILAEVNDDQL